MNDRPTADLRGASRRSKMRRGIAVFGAAIVFAVVSLLLLRGSSAVKTGQPKKNESGVQAAIADADDAVLAGYGGSETCKNCHRGEYDRWSTSHHALAERPVAAEHDRIAFDPPRTIAHGAQTSQARIHNGTYQLVTMGLSGKRQAHDIARVIGVDPLREFLVPGPRGRVQATELAFDPRRDEWFDVYGAEDRQAGEWGHWTGRGMTWNAMCATCHNTRLRKNYDQTNDSYQTRMAEMSVGCEACHGPMKAHAKWRENPKNAGKADQSLAHPSRDQMTDTCGSCHARRDELTGDFVPGQIFFDHYALTGVDESDLFYPDGQVRDEDYEYSAFLGSKMHAAGVRCMDCHDVHSGKPLFDGDALCMRCHVGAYPKAPIVNPALHTFHAPSSAGSRCVNCHMPQTAYMQRHARHDHGFTTPDPLLTKRIGVPNACNRCHLDKDADWSLASVNAWYGAKMDRPTRRRALIIAAGRNRESWSKPVLLAMLSDAATTAYWRSGIVRILAQWVDESAVRSVIAALSHDIDPMVRESVVTALAPTANQDPDAAKAIAAAMDDPSRNVRIVAAGARAPGLVPESPATRDYLRYLDQHSDEPIGQLALARYEIDRNRFEEAAVHLRRAVEFDSRSALFRREVATLFGRIGKPQEALAQIAVARDLEPANSEYWFLYGLAASEAGQGSSALAAFEKAVNLDPKNARAWYNLALARQKAGQAGAALIAYAKAQAADPSDADIPYAKATLFIQLHRPSEARDALKRTLSINPNYPQAQELLQSLQDPPSN
ncbi:MAG TPA: tetratricopeptide repeat protein [Tepidisphaeraceae bacterium]|jgi:tetratricopeptide (TPR) repeat protein|nr:tetratricopeptide repeat protein [Tepidisphaeraceae bacterium]